MPHCRLTRSAVWGYRQRGLETGKRAGMNHSKSAKKKASWQVKDPKAMLRKVVIDAYIDRLPAFLTIKNRNLVKSPNGYLRPATDQQE